MENLNQQKELFSNIKEFKKEEDLIENMSLKCPKCKTIFTINEFENSELSKVHYEQFVKKMVELTKSKIEKDCEKKINCQIWRGFKK